MGHKGSRAYGNVDYKLKYDEDWLIRNSMYYRPRYNAATKTVKVIVDKGITENIQISDNELTVGWLLSEVTRRYDKYYEDNNEVKKLDLNPKKLIVGLKSIMFLPSLDLYLTGLDNLLSPIKNNTTLTVHFSKIK